jgi:hypothetical protein
VLFLEVRVELEPGAHSRVPPAHDDRETIRAETLPPDLLRERQRHVDREVEGTGRECPLDRSTPHLHDAQVDTRRGASDAPHEPRQHADLDRITHRNRELRLGLSRIEATPPLEKGLERAQRSRERADQPVRQRCGSQAAAVADEQRVMEQVPQARQRVTDRGLAEMQLLTRAGDAAFAVDRLENDEEVQVDPREITHVDGFLF